ncbi:hypothetical protein OIV83_001245 [Microbotryomycetes sp. JL201]|nr:hypothetical protein OIV83_001245 [Microbotryomycetes sp. JL201]
MDPTAQPRIAVQTVWLDIDAHEQLPPFVAHVTLMRDCAFVNVGAPEQGIAISQDWSCAMPRRETTASLHTQPAAATSLSANASSTANTLSLGLAAKLGKFQ